MKKLNKLLISTAILSGAYLTWNTLNSKTELTKISKEIILPAKTKKGKFLRTYRWDKILDEKEQKYKIEKGLLKGLAMRESYGDPIRLNESYDGGAGLFQFQPGTAKYYGLKIYGNSNNTGKDKKHGKELRQIVTKNNYEYEKLSNLDERFDIEKSSEAAAKFLNELYKRHGSWNKAISAYNRGKPAKYPNSTNHVKKVREYQEYYNNRDKD